MTTEPPDPTEPADPETAGAPPPGGRPTRVGIVAVVVVGVLLLVALVLVVTQRDPVDLPADSPEATVQAWLQSLVDGEPDTSRLADISCPDPDRQRIGDGQLRVTVRETSIDEDTATVELEVTELYGLGVFEDGFDHVERYRLRRTDDGWRITGFDWPWDLCWNDAMREDPGEVGTGEVDS